MEKRDIELVRALQNEEIFLTERPFHEAASLLGWTIEEVLERVKALKEEGVIRRFGAALTPRNAGFRSNSMIAWDVVDTMAEEAGSLMSEHPRVSHCYIRPRFEGFPFNIYTMVHGSSPVDLARIIDELAALAAASSYRALHSLKEFKKSSPVYYPKALEPENA
jgi:DNA-binding Lrp family transcriptional regulator